MKRIAVLLCVLTYLLPCAQRSLAQATAYLTEDETLVNGVLGIQLDCHAYGSWDLDGSGQDYAGVSIGGSTYHGCQLNDPNGQYNYLDSGGPYAGDPLRNPCAGA